MDTQQPTPQPSTTPQPVSKPNLKDFVTKKKKVLIIGGVVLLVLLLIALAFAMKQKSNGGKSIFNTLTSRSGSSGSGGENSKDGNGHDDFNKPEGAIARAGDEYIFQRDLDYELSFQPVEHTEKLKKTLLEKLVKDSIVLQAAEKEKLITIGEREFNVEEKDYQKRLELLKSVQTKIDGSVDKISGTMVSVWFYNMMPAKIGLEKGKAEAFRRITELHQKVQNKQMTIEQAGQSIINDPSYNNLDFGYTNNALIPFTMQKGKQITFDEGFDKILWITAPGQLTPVYLATVVNEFSHKDEESFYVFALITSKQEKGNAANFETWSQEQKGKYEVAYF